MDYLLQSSFDFGERGVQHGATRVKHDVPRVSETRAMEPKGFPQAAFDAVALDGFADRAGNGEAQARSGRGLGARPGKTKGGEQGS